jgi:hypothetical protein
MGKDEPARERVGVRGTSLQVLGPYRFFHYAGESQEPVHIHIEREDKIAKFWLDPVRLQSSRGFNRAEIRQIQKIITQYQEHFVEAWHAYYGKSTYRPIGRKN